MRPVVKVFVAFGSNQNNPLLQVETALKNLNRLPEVRLLKVSSWYSNPAQSTIPQPDFINGVGAFETTLSPIRFLSKLQKIEKLQGRIINTLRNSPRTLDLDILTYGDEIIDLRDLQVPHPRMKSRDFVLLPLLEIAPSLILPDGNSIQKLVQTLTIRPSLKRAAGTYCSSIVRTQSSYNEGRQLPRIPESSIKANLRVESGFPKQQWTSK